MTLTVTGRHLTVTQALRTDITRKLARLERLLGDNAVSAQVILSLDGQSTVCELTVHARGDHMLHGVGRHRQLPSAVTAAVERVATQARRLKDRWKARRRTALEPSVAAAEARPEAAGKLAKGKGAPKPGGSRRARTRVIRSRARALKPMTVDDAILVLTEETRSFLVFREAQSESLAILYLRPDGHYGLIEPEG